MIKLFVADMDGTLLNPQMRITPATAEAIKRLQEAGIEFMIATGRSYSTAQPLLNPYGITCSMITLNGAAFVEADGRHHSLLPLDPDIARSMINFLDKNKIDYALMTKNDFYMHEPDAFLKDIQSYIDEQVKDLAKDQDVDPDKYPTDFIHPIEDFEFSEEDPVMKIMVLTADQDEQHLFKQNYQANPDIDITSSWINNLEITSYQAQKGLAVNEYALENDLLMSEIVVIGDSLNDRSMMKMAGHSFAMANASEEIKNLATYMAPANKHDGVAYVIDEILNGKYS